MDTLLDDHKDDHRCRLPGDYNTEEPELAEHSIIEPIGCGYFGDTDCSVLLFTKFKLHFNVPDIQYCAMKVMMKNLHGVDIPSINEMKSFRERLTNLYGLSVKQVLPNEEAYVGDVVRSVQMMFECASIEELENYRKRYVCNDRVISDLENSLSYKIYYERNLKNQYFHNDSAGKLLLCVFGIFIDEFTHVNSIIFICRFGMSSSGSKTNGYTLFITNFYRPIRIRIGLERGTTNSTHTFRETVVRLHTLLVNKRIVVNFGDEKLILTGINYYLC